MSESSDSPPWYERFGKHLVDLDDMTEEDWDTGDPENRDMTEEESEIYMKHIKDSGGFDVPHFPGATNFGMIIPAAVKENAEELFHYIKFALEDQRKKWGKNLEVTEYIKWNLQFACPVNYYITFKSRDLDNGDEDVYETLVCSKFPDSKSEVAIFRRQSSRLKRKKPPTEENDDEEKDNN